MEKKSSSPDHSYNRLDGAESIATRPDVHSLDTGSIGKPFLTNYHEAKYSSTYVPHNRLSRYATALTNLVPIRFKRVPGSELPLDKIGLFSSVSLSWLNEYLSAGRTNGMRDKSLPSAAVQDSCQVNGPRLDGLWHAHVVERGQAGASVPHIAWKFVRTRVLMASLIYLLGMLISLSGPILILPGIISSIEDRNHLYNGTFSNGSSLFASTATTAGNESVSNVTTIASMIENATILVTTKALLPNTTPSTRIRETATAVLSNATGISIGRKLVNKLPDSFKHKIMVDEIIIFSDVGLLITVEVVSYFLIAWSATMNLRTASRLRSACLALMYKKLIRSSVRYTASAHQTITYFVPDSETLYELITNGPLIFTGPIVLLLTSFFIWHMMGHWALIGIAVLITLYLCLILTAYLTKVFATKTMEFSLRRMSLTEELLTNIYLAKVTLWDNYFKSKIEETRRKELAEKRLGGLSEGWSLCMVHLIPIITVCASTMAGLITHKDIVSASYIPVVVILLINLKHCVRNSWLAMSSISRGITSLNKLKIILILKDADRYPDKPIDKNLAVTINRGNFTWAKENSFVEKVAKRSSQFYLENQEGHPVRFASLTPVQTLTDINFYAPKAKLIGVCGRPGSGKSSLLLAILGHLHHVSGHVTRDGSCAYAPEDQWILDGTLKENILFGEVFDANRYYRAVRSCLLNNDMAVLPASDDTELTEMNLSLAQKQRIVLARAVYANRDINLLDNPLADVDINESREIFDKCFMHAMKSKTIIMVSDKIQFLNRCDTIYVMKEGRIVEQGTHEELLQWQSEYARLVNSYMKKYQRKYYREGEQLSPSSSNAIFPAVPRGMLSSISTSASLDSILEDFDDTVPLKRDRNYEFPIKYSTDERKPLLEYGVYVRNAGGWALAILICLISTISSFFLAVAPLCFTYIAQKTIYNNMQISLTFVTLVGPFILFGLILMFVYNKTVFNAAFKLHDNWLDGLYSAQIRLFSTTPISVLLNICTLNLHEVDSVLPRSIITLLMHMGISAFSVAILGLISPWLLIPITLFVLVSILYSIYVRGAILGLYEVKINSVVPMYHHAVNTIEGRTVIQAYHKERDFTRKFYKYCDNNSTYNFMLYAIKLWIEYRLKMLSALTLGAVVLMCISLTSIRDRFEYMCLALICTLQLATSIINITSTTTSTYTSFMALTGLDFYVENIPRERPGTASLPANWPTDSSIRFDNALLAIGPDTDPSLDILSFTIASGEKVAIIGSQTSARMSIVSALFRLIEVASGNICVGNTNIADVPMPKLRQCICFIPGDPLLFNGNIKYNLDPTGNVSEKVLMTVLQRVFLWEKVSKLPNKLDNTARNVFTTGEKKLLFFARAIVRKTFKIIIIEESMTDLGPDAETIEMILREVFSEYTVIALSNQRVRYCTRTLQLSDGKINETSNRKSSSSQHSLAASEVFTVVPVKNVFETSF